MLLPCETLVLGFIKSKATKDFSFALAFFVAQEKRAYPKVNSPRFVFLFVCFADIFFSLYVVNKTVGMKDEVALLIA